MDQDPSGWKTLRTRANQLVRSATHPAAQLPVEGHLPGFDEATGWLNSPPLTAAGLRGQVVLVQFWTYTCINWLRTLAYIRAWAAKYSDHGLTVVGVHTPEFDFEHDPDNVRQAVTDLRVTYPVAVDSDYGIWSAFANLYWPASYFVDAQGQIRHHRFGEGDYQMSEMILQQLLTEAGAGGHRPGPDLGRRPRGGSRRRLGQPAVPGELPRLRAHRQLRLPQWFHSRYELCLCRPGAVGAQPLGPVG